MGHLGAKVSALLDGQLDPAEEERAWAHVHACHFCRDAVEREGWVKTRLNGLGSADLPSHQLVGALLDPGSLNPSAPSTRRRTLTAAGGGAAVAVGAAVVGVLALGAVPGSTPGAPSAASDSRAGSPSARTPATMGPVALTGVMDIANPVLNLIAYTHNPFVQTPPTRKKPAHKHAGQVARGKMSR